MYLITRQLSLNLCFMMTIFVSNKVFGTGKHILTYFFRPISRNGDFTMRLEIIVYVI